MILIIATILYGSLFFYAPNESYEIDYNIKAIAYGVSIELLIIVMFYNSFSKTPHCNQVEKSGWFSLTTWSAMNLVVFTWFGHPVLSNIIIAVIELFLFTGMLTYSQVRGYDLKSDEYCNNSTFIVFKKPISFFDYFLSGIFLPCSSVSIVSNGMWFGYQWGVPYKSEPHVFSDNDIYIKVGSLNHSIVVDALEQNINQRWRLFNNCCRVVWRCFPDKRFSLLDHIPCYFMKTILKERS